MEGLISLRKSQGRFKSGNTLVPRRNVIVSNVHVNYEETFRLAGKFAQTDFGENYVSDKDPGFVNAERLDFQLKDNSVVYKELPGFERIPFEKMGPRKSEDRR